MQLLTDYHQWYDGIFDGQPPVFHRQAFTRGGLSKRRQFELFESLGLRTPRHGVVRELAAELNRPLLGCAAPPEALAETRLVVYLDEYAHRGEGKRLLTLVEAAGAFPDLYASVYHPAVARGRVFRLARLGRLSFWIEQQGQSDDWRSNREEAEQVLASCRADAPNPIPRVLWAADFLATADGLLAIDLNTAPDLTTLGETGVLSPSEVAEELTWARETNPGHLRQF